MLYDRPVPLLYPFGAYVEVAYASEHKITSFLARGIDTPNYVPALLDVCRLISCPVGHASIFRRDYFFGPRGIICRLVGKSPIDASVLVPRAVGLMGLMLLAGPYLGRETRHIALRRGDESMSEDGLHPNDESYWVIADRLGNLGYEPLYPR